MTSHTGRRLAAPILAVLLAAFSLGPAAPPSRAAHAGAASLPFPVGVRVSASAKPGPVNLVTASVSAPITTSCTLQISAAHLETTLPSRQLGSAVWRWRAPVPAPRGVWTFTATCREGARWTAAWYKAELGFPGPSGALLGASGRGTSPARETCDAQRVCFANDPFPAGQCSWYAVGRRPDLAGIVHGPWWAWLRAAKGRVPEGSRPAVGAIAVYAPDLRGGSGHVGYVAEISGGRVRGRVLLDDSNWSPTPWSPRLQVHEHWEAARAASGYIYGGPAGAGP